MPKVFTPVQHSRCARRYLRHRARGSNRARAGAGCRGSEGMDGAAVWVRKLRCGSDESLNQGPSVGFPHAGENARGPPSLRMTPKIILVTPNSFGGLKYRG